MSDEPNTEVADAPAPEAETVAEQPAVETPPETVEPVETEKPADRPSSGSAGAQDVPQPIQPVAPTALEREIAAAEAIIDNPDADPFSPQVKKAHKDFARLVAKQEAQPIHEVKEVIDRDRQARHYWQTWGKGTDVAQKMHGAVPVTRAKALFQQVQDEVAANPRYANRPEMHVETIVYDKWLDALAAEQGKKPGAPSKPAGAPSPRVTGSAAANNPSISARKTAAQKLEDGDYGDLAAEQKRMGGM